MYLNYGLIEYFTLIQITFGIFNAIDLRLKQGSHFLRGKSEAKYALKMKTVLNLVTSNEAFRNHSQKWTKNDYLELISRRLLFEVVRSRPEKLRNS